MSESAADAALRQQDAEARAQAQTVFERPLVIEAGAGTGKTQTLVSRIVAWSVGPGWERAVALAPSAASLVTPRADVIATRVLSGVVAITFTEAAAAEMSARLGEMLAAIERGERPAGVLNAALDRAGPALGERARALLGALDHVVIRTIHAYCRRLLGRYPIEADVHPNLKVDADGTLQAEVVRGVVEAAMRRGYAGPNDDVLLTLAEYEVGPLQIEEAINALVAENVPPDAFAADPYRPERIREAVAELHRTVRDLAIAIDGRVASLGTKSLAAKVGAALGESLRYLSSGSIENIAQMEACAFFLSETWPKNLLTRVREWGRDIIGPREREALAGRVDGIVDASRRLGSLLSQWSTLNPVVLDLARRAMGPLLDEAYQQLRMRGVATYAALLHDVRAMLERHPDTADVIRRDISLLLVDELQDTDVVQCAIIRTLALSGSVTDRPSLFLVGDPKQSIYGWRSADLRAYDDFVNAVLANGGVRHILSVNYRSLPTILTEVTRTIAPIMQHVDGLQPAFQPLIPAPSRIAADAPRAQPSVEYWLSTPWDAALQQPMRGRAADLTVLEARALASDLRRVHDEDGVPWSDIGILFRSGTDLDVYLGALRDVGIPYLVEGDRQYYERREVIDAAALLRTVLEPYDQLALLTVLRSAMVGVPDAALLPLWLRGFPAAVAALVDASPAPIAALGTMIESVVAELPPSLEGLDRVRGWEISLLRAVESIAAARASFALDPVDVFVERLRALFLPEAIEASRRLGAYRLANLERFFRQLLAALDQGETDPQQLIRRLRTAIAQRIDAEEERPSDGADDAVQVLTIHRAKGLDFAHVYVMQLHKGPGTTWDALVDVARNDDDYEYCLFKARTLSFWTTEARRAAVAAAEQVRTLYVAMTRAKSRLVLCGDWPNKHEAVAVDRARSQVELLLSREPSPPDLDALMLATAREQRWYADAGDVRWVFPALLPARSGRAQEDAVVMNVARIEADAERLTELTATAERRSARRLVMPVTTAAAELLDDAAMVADERGTMRAARIARAIGIAVHATLEVWSPTDDPAAVLAASTDRVHTLLRAAVAGDEAAEALDAAKAVLHRLMQNRCGARLRAIADHIVARELPVLIPPTNDDSGPVGCFTGAIDLIYRDPDTGELVVADYKTDDVQTDGEIALHVDAYRSQGAHYVRAVHQALQLGAPPRFELWFLQPGRIETIRV